MNTIERSLVSWSYDPQRDGYSSGSIFATISGTPVIASTDLSLTSAHITGVQAMVGPLTCEMTLTVPTAPTAGHTRFWGMSLPYLGNRAKVGFVVSGTVFSVVVYDNTGTALFNQVVTWDSGYTNTSTRFKILVGQNGVRFYANDVLLTGTAGTGNYDAMISGVPASMPNLPTSVDINNGVADAMLVSGLFCSNVSQLA